MNRRAFLQTAGFGTGIAFTAARRAFAQSYPSRAVRVVVPASASTPPDILARIIANNLSEREGWKMIVENKPGAVMTIGISDVLKQEPDGYNLLSTTAPIAAVPGLMPNASFNIETDFKPIIQVGTGYNVLVSQIVSSYRVRTDHISQAGFKPAYFFIRRLRDARAFAWRVVQTRNRGSGYPCSLRSVSTGNRGSSERREHLPIHHCLARR